MKGMLWGAAIGAGVALLLAPASGDETRERLMERTNEWRDQAMQTAETARAKAEALQERGREMVNENATRLTRTAEAVKKTAEETWNQPVDEPAEKMPANGNTYTPPTMAGRVP
jgi:gas vesicle protein